MASGLIVFVGLLAAGPLWTLASGRVPVHGDWRTATHRSSGLAPDPAAHPEAVVQVYAARVFGWRGAFAVHTWLAAKPKDAKRYTRYEVIGWYGGGDRSVISITDTRPADAEWYGAAPSLLADLRGPAAEAAIARLPAVVDSYAGARSYRMWPGPNSNTFTAHLSREIPELHLTLPSTAIGKDYVPLDRIVSRTPSGTGYQLSLLGMLGASLDADEGLEINVLGFVFGIDPRHFAVKLPGIGRIPERPQL
ncbi:MAG TPA: DUF3750 domain-containing protein [Casimicrobiaceae bacterium]|nr:DUF3750 domain-containing protein [Casimicrobiaceae bacterium]